MYEQNGFSRIFCLTLLLNSTFAFSGPRAPNLHVILEYRLALHLCPQEELGARVAHTVTRCEVWIFQRGQDITPAWW